METENDRKMKFWGLPKEALVNEDLMKGVKGQLGSEESPKPPSLCEELEEKRVSDPERWS